MVGEAAASKISAGLTFLPEAAFWWIISEPSTSLASVASGPEGCQDCHWGMFAVGKKAEQTQRTLGLLCFGFCTLGAVNILQAPYSLPFLTAWLLVWKPMQELNSAARARTDAATAAGLWSLRTNLRATTPGLCCHGPGMLLSLQEQSVTVMDLCVYNNLKALQFQNYFYVMHL